MTELLIALMVAGIAMIVFAPLLAGRAARPATTQTASGDLLHSRRAELLEEKARVLRNLRELDSERAAGRVSETDYQALKRRDQVHAARLLQQIEQLEGDLKAGRKAAGRAPEAAAAPTSPRQRLTRTLGWAGGVLAFAVVLAVTMSRAITPRAPGGTITGTIPGSEGAPADAGGGGGSGGAAAFLPGANPARLGEVERLVSRDSSNLPALIEAGHLYIAERRLDEAARVTMRALRQDRNAAEAYAHVAVLLFAEASTHDDADSAQVALQGALDASNQAIRLDARLAEAWLFKGMIYMAGMRDPQSAAQAWEEYLKVAPAGADTARIAGIVRSMRRGSQN